MYHPYRFICWRRLSGFAARYRPDIYSTSDAVSTLYAYGKRRERVWFLLRKFCRCVRTYREREREGDYWLYVEPLINYPLSTSHGSLTRDTTEYLAGVPYCVTFLLRIRKWQRTGGKASRDKCSSALRLISLRGCGCDYGQKGRDTSDRSRTH